MHTLCAEWPTNCGTCARRWNSAWNCWLFRTCRTTSQISVLPMMYMLQTNHNTISICWRSLLSYFPIDHSRHSIEHNKPWRQSPSCVQCQYFLFWTSVSCCGVCESVVMCLVLLPSDVRNSVATLVVYPPGPLSRLIDIYFDTLEATTIGRLER